MSLLLPSTLPASRKLPFRSTFSDLRTSSSSSPSTSSSFSLSPIPPFVSRASLRKRHRCPFSAIQLQTMSQRIDAVSTNSAEDLEEHLIPCRSFRGFRSEEELLADIDKESALGTVPSNCSSIMRDLCRDYRNAVLHSGICDANEIVLSNMTALFDRILSDAKDPFLFPSYHKAMREPFDYYMFGQNFIRPLIDFKKSFLGNINIFGAMKADVEQGHNVILISNHQTEADPAIIALLLQKFHPSIAEDLIYVAGDRVLTDVICKPFSMGRNLLCVYSKKHMCDDPAVTGMKKAANLRSLKEMAALLRNGSQIIWIAPSGGRDRPDRQSGEWHPASFDPSSVDNMRRIAEHAGPVAHFFPLALLCYNIMPPPLEVEKEIGERRAVGFNGVGLSVAPEIKYHAVPGASENPDEAKAAYTKAMYDSVNEQYNVLKSAINRGGGLEASTPRVSLSQPW